MVAVSVRIDVAFARGSISARDWIIHATSVFLFEPAHLLSGVNVLYRPRQSGTSSPSARPAKAARESRSALRLFHKNRDFEQMPYRATGKVIFTWSKGSSLVTSPNSSGNPTNRPRKKAAFAISSTMLGPAGRNRASIRNPGLPLMIP